MSKLSSMLLRLDKKFHRNGSHLLTGQSVAEPAPLNWIHLLLVCVFIILIPAFIEIEFNRYPVIPDLGISELGLNEPLLDADQFVALRAKRLVQRMTTFGLRTMGSDASEVKTVGLIVDWLQKIKQQLTPNNSFSQLTYTVDQVNSPSEQMDVYRSTLFLNLTNILVRVDPVEGNTKDAFLVNCHFDVTFESMGAGDNGINCAIMLEMIRALMTSKTPLKNSVVFLFNGGEEKGLLGAYAFLQGDSKDGGYVAGAGHPWANDIRAFLNVDASGSGGREILFQTGPGAASHILLRAYAAGAKYPFASVLGQEVFQSGIIPSGTDYQIFREVGNLPGIDIAFYSNGYVYHTRYDTPDRIADGAYQRAGTNYLGIVRELANSNLSAIPTVNKEESYNDKLVFFDVFSYFMIIYPFDTVGQTGVILIAVLVVARIFLSACFGRTTFAKMFGFTFLAQFASILVAIGTFFLLGYVIGLSKQCMFWYSKPWLVIFIYALPAVVLAIGIQAAVFKFLIRRFLRIRHEDMCISAYSVSLDVAFLFLTTIVIALQVLRVASGYMLVIYLAWPLAMASLIGVSAFVASCFGISFTNERFLSYELLIKHAAITLFPTLFLFYPAYILLEVFIPIFGRSSINQNPEYAIVTMVAVLTILVLLLHAPIVHLSGGNVLRLAILINLVIVGAYICVFATSVGNAFSVDQTLPRGVREQRSITQLTLVKSDKVDNGNSTRAGLWYQPADYLKEKPLRTYSSELDNLFGKSRKMCPSANLLAIYSRMFCSYPDLLPDGFGLTDDTFWIDMKASEETLSRVKFPDVQFMQKNQFKDGITFFQFRIDCGDTAHCRFHYETDLLVNVLGQRHDLEQVPINDLQLNFTSFYESFRRVRFGSSTSGYTFYLTLKVRNHRSFMGYQPKIIFSLGAHQFRSGVFSSSSDGLPQELVAFCEMLPDWHHTTAFTGLYNERVILL